MRPVHAGKKRDSNEKAIVKALRAAGATVEQLSGPDVPDLLVGFRGRNWLFEVKTNKGKLSMGQERWAQKWQGDNVWTVREPHEALWAIGIIATRK